MKKYFTLPVFALLFASALIGAGCPTVPVNNSPGNNSNNTAAIPEPAASVNKTDTPANSDVPMGSLATPTDAYKTAYAIRQRKDVDAFKRVLSAEIVEFFTEIGKLEKKSLDEMLMELLEKPQASTAEVRNEKRTGDRAILEYKDEKGEWKEMDFVKEGGEWKLTLPKAEGPESGKGGTPKK